MSDDSTAEPGMEKEQITLPDGRYLIYYTFPTEPDHDSVILSSSKDEPES